MAGGRILVSPDRRDGINGFRNENFEMRAAERGVDGYDLGNGEGACLCGVDSCVFL